MRSRSRLVVPLAAAVLAIGLAAAGLSSPQPALAVGGRYVETATTTYIVDPGHGRIEVAIDIAFENTTPPSVGSVYYSSVFVWVERAATHLRATTDGGSAAMSRVRRATGFDEYLIRYGQAVYYGGTRNIHVTYQLPSGAPRSTSDIRVGKASASFCVVGQGDDGGTTRVVIPADYRVSITGGDGGDITATSSSGAAGGNVTWSTGKLDQPFAFWACLSGTNEAGFTTTSLASPSGREIKLESWPEDPAWRGEVQGELGGILTTLETLVGRGLPGRGPIVIRETASGLLGAYAGFFNPVTGEIVMGEDLGQGGVVAHELSHAWFNDTSLLERWMSEGMAEWARVSTVTDRCPLPLAYPGPEGVPHLERWEFAGPRADITQVAVVQYEYNAACYIVTTLAARAGPDRWRAVIASLLDDKLAYQSATSALAHPRFAATWRQWLDAVDEVGLVPAGATDLDFAQDLLARYGIANDTTALKNRSAARATYHALVADLGDWTMPEAILRPMSEWGFGVATTAMDRAAAILASVSRADEALPGIDATHGPVRTLFQDARSVDDLGAAAARAADQAAAADAVAAAAARIAAPRDAFGELGLVGSDLAGLLAAATSAAKSADLAGAQASVSSINSTLDGAPQQGVIRVVLAIAAVGLVVLLVAYPLVRRRRRATAPVVVLAEGAALTGIALHGEAPEERADPVIDRPDPVMDRTDP